MDRSERLFLLLVFIAIAVWRLVRFLRLGMGKPRPSLGLAGGWVPSSSESAVPGATASAGPDRPDSLPIRMAGLFVAVAIWLVGNLLIWVSLFQLPFLQSVPPAVLGMAGIFANFYLIPFARRAGQRCSVRLMMARAENQLH
jgi:hypothetical protein